MPVNPRVDIRFYSNDGDERRPIPPACIGPANWRTVRYGGYADATFNLSGALSDIGFVQENDRVRVFIAGQLRWSGFVSAVHLTPGDPTAAQIEAVGMFSRVASLVLDGRFISPYEVDISDMFASFANREIKAAYPNLYVDVESADFGLMVQTEDAFGKDAGGLLQSIAERIGGVAVYGCDEFPSSLGETIMDRLFLRETGDLNNPDYTLAVPGLFGTGAVEGSDGGADISRLVNRLTLTGSGNEFPNLLEAACNGNVGFERPILEDGSLSNRFERIYNSFELSGYWTYGSGADRKAGGLTEGAARSGEQMAELDNVGEYIERLITATLSAGTTEVIGIWARRESSGNSATFKIVVQFKNGGADVGSPIETTFPPLPASNEWRRYGVAVEVPSSVTGYVVRYELTAKGAGSTGAVLDDAFAYKAGIRQDGWYILRSGSGVVNKRDLAADSDRQGRYCVYLDATGADTDTDYTRYVTTGKFAVDDPTLPLVWGADFKYPPGVTSHGLFWVAVDWFDKNGGLITFGADVITAGSGTFTDWVQTEYVSTPPSNAASGQFYIWWRGASQLLIDRPYVRAAECPTIGSPSEREWVDDGPYRITLSVTDLEVPNLSTPIRESIQNYGIRQEQIQSDAIFNRATAIEFARRYFEEHALPRYHPQVRIADTPVVFFPGQTVRLAGESGPALTGATTSPAPALPIAEVSESVDGSGKVVTLLSLEQEPWTDERIVREIVRQQIAAGTGGGIVAYALGAASGTVTARVIP